MTAKAKILIIDDEPDILEILNGLLKGEGYDTRLAQSGDEAVERFKREAVDVVITDIRMPGMSGLEVLRTIKGLDDKAEIIVLTGHASIETAISALKNEGAFDFLTKPLEHLEDVLISVEKAIAHRQLIVDNERLMEKLSRRQAHLEAYNEELRQTKQELEISRYRYEDLYDQAPVGYLTLDVSGRIIEANQTAATLFRQPKTQILSKSLVDLLAPQETSRLSFDPARFINNMPHAGEVQMIRSNGDIFYAHLESLAIFKADGSVDQMRITVSDVSEPKRVELALKESEQRYRSFVQNFKGIAFCLEADGKPVFYHGAVEETTGYNESQLVNNHPSWEDLIHPEELELVRSRRKIVAISEDRNITHEYRIRHSNKQWRWVREHIQSLGKKEPQSRILHGVIFDIDEHKQLQNQYVESRKLDAVATMAAGIAHQFNNALAGLMGNLELLAMDDEQYRNHAKYTDPMMEMVQGMAQLTKQLLAYARGGKYLPGRISVRELVHQSINLMEHRLSDKYHLDIQLSSENDHIIADSTQMQMVVLATMENALEAMSDGGTITIESDIHDIISKSVQNGYTHPPGSYLSLCITDNGCGMDLETSGKIFDPFFTTKFIGRGLSLSAAYGIVVNHNGWMEVDSQMNHGTTMRILLPLAVNQTATADMSGPDRLVKGDATVLVVEDEEMVMKAVHELLDRLEYRVLEARTGHTALEVLRSFDGQIDIALLDVRLPDLDALDLYEKMCNIRPELKVIVCSGYNEDGPVKELLNSGAAAFLQKPFTVARLSAELKAALEDDTGDQSQAANRLQVI